VTLDNPGSAFNADAL